MNLNLIVLASVVILVVAGLAWLYVRQRRSTTAGLRQKFGPEYQRAVQEHGSERKAEAKLAVRQERVEKLKIRDLDPMEHERFSKQWASVQSRFVDSPKGAVTEADDLVSSLMKTRGYPVSDFNQRADDISVDHPGGGELPVRARDCVAGWQGRRHHGRSENGDDSLSLSVRGTSADTNDCGKERGGVMGELMTKEEELAKAETAGYDIPREQPDGLKLVKGQEPDALDKAAAVPEPVPLFSDSEMKDFRSQWSNLQTGFVDEPRPTVEGADKLVAAVMQRLAEGFAHERSGLEKQWDSGDNVSTEDLRVALQRYRSFFDRLLKL